MSSEDGSMEESYLSRRNNNSTDSETTDPQALEAGKDDLLQEQLWETNERMLCGIHVQKNTITCLQLTILFIILIIFGGLIFHLIEHPQEVQNLETKKHEYQKSKQEIINILYHYDESEDIDSALSVYSKLQKYANGFEDVPDEINHWRFSKALIFSFTIITTIGYGTFAPSTLAGQMFLVVYALIGIPVTGLSLGYIAERALYVFTWLSQVGSDKAEEAFRQFDLDGSGELDEEEFREAVKILGFELKPTEFKKLWSEVDLDGGGTVDLAEFREAIRFMHADVTEAAGQKHKILITGCGLLLWIVIGWVYFSLVEHWRPDRAFYFIFVSLTTIGLGDFFPETIAGLFFLVFFAMIGLGLVAILLTLVESFMKDLEKTRAREMIEARERDQNMKILRQIPIFACMREEELHDFVEITTTISYGPNIEFIKEGKNVDLYYVMIEGTVIISKKNSSQEVTMASPSLLLDTSFLQNKSDREAKKTVRTATDTVLLSLDIEDWDALTKMKVINLKMLSVAMDNKKNRAISMKPVGGSVRSFYDFEDSVIGSGDTMDDLEENKRKTTSFEW